VNADTHRHTHRQGCHKTHNTFVGGGRPNRTQEVAKTVKFTATVGYISSFYT